MSFTRRPFLASQTDVPVISQPTIYGTAHVDNNGLITAVQAAIEDSTTAFELSIETDVGPLDVEFTGVVTALPLADIVEAINSAATSSDSEVQASAIQGVLVLKSPTPGDGAFVRILAASSGYADLAPLLGFARHPHPAATVTAGDLGSSSPRAMTQGNRPLSAFLARGEDRTSESFNRALHSLSKNLDAHQFQITRGVATPVVLNILSSSLRFTKDATTGVITRVDLRTGFSDPLDTVLARDIFVGIANNAELTEIASCFAVLDGDDNEILAGDRVVRIGTVAYVPSSGSIGGASTFNSSTELLDSALSISDAFDSYRNVLGHESMKQDSVVIEQIIDGSTIICSSASFIANGVEEGDLVYISGATTLTPQSNDGTFVVDVVVSETEIIVRPADVGSGLRLLNEASDETLVVKSNGQFEDSLVLWFEPALPRVPESGLRLIVGMHSSVAELDPTALLIPALNSAEEVDGWVLKNLHRNLNLDGVYQGQGQDKGGGHFAKVTHRPIILHSEPVAASNTLVRSGSDGDIIAGNRLEVDAAATFTLEDVGRSIYFTMGADTYSDWRITRLIDARTVELTPPPHEIGTVLTPGEVDNWDIYDELFSDFPAAISNITESSTAGGFHVTKVGTNSKDLSFAHFEQLTRSMVGGSVNSNLATMSGTFSLGNIVTNITDSTGAVVDPIEIWSLYAAERSGGRTPNRQGFRSFVRVLNGTEPGFYEVKKVRSSEIQLLNIDGTTPTSSSEVQFSIYTLRMGVGVPVFGADETGSVGLDVFQRQDPSVSAGNHQVYAIRAGWEGTGAGVLVTANDDSFEALGVTGIHSVARGYAIEVEAYAPANGIKATVASSDSEESQVSGLTVQARGFGFNPTFVIPTNDGIDFSLSDSQSFGALFAQTGVDPGLVVIKDPAGHDIPSTESGVTASAAAVIIRQDEGAVTATTGLGSALETVGSIWVHASYNDGTKHHARGGVFSEDVMGVGRYLYPIWGSDTHFHELETWADSSNWASPTTLGRAGQILPAQEGDTLTVNVAAPNYDKFNFVHTATISIGDVSSIIGLRDPASLVGCIAFFPDSGEAYSILALHHGGGPRVFFAIKGSVPLSTATDVACEIRGLRWHRAYLNIADWALIGTWDSAKELYELPLIASDPYAVRDRADTSVTLTSAFTNLSVPSWSPALEGSSIGAAPDYDSGTQPALTDPSSWSGTAENPFHATQWSGFSNEPAAPFYARDAVIGTGLGGYRYSDVRKVGVTGGTLSFDSQLGGTLVVTRHASSTTTIAVRGRRFIWENHLAVRVNLRVVAKVADSTLTLSLVKVTSGTPLASATLELSSMLALFAEMQSHSVTLVNSDLVPRTSDALSNSLIEDDVELQIDIPGHASESAIVFQEIFLEQITDPMVVSGPAIVSGAVTANTFRFFNPVKGYQTIHPAEVRMLDGEDYGVAISWPKEHDGTDYVSPPTSFYTAGMQELRGGPGLIRTTSESAQLGYAVARTHYDVDTGDQGPWITGVEAIFNQTTHTSALAKDLGYPIDLRVYLLEDRSPRRGPSLIAKLDSLEEYDAIIIKINDYNASPSTNAFNDVYNLVLNFIALFSGSTEPFSRPKAQRQGAFLDAIEDLEDHIATFSGPLDPSTDIDGADLIRFLASINPPTDIWIRPEKLSPPSIGPNSATLVLDSPVQDPLWYRMHAHLLTNELLTTVSGFDSAVLDRSAFVPPGHTGFIIPLDPPHGSVLSTINISMSFVPCSADAWGIYKDPPAAFWQENNYYADVADPEDWEGEAGVYVEVWRFKVLDDLVEEEPFARWSSYLPEYGYGELIHRESIDLPEGGAPDQDVNVASSWQLSDVLFPREIYAGREYFVKKSFDISAPEDSGLRVDRRIFSYAMVIRFIGGPRKEYSGLALPFSWSDSAAPHGVLAIGEDPNYYVPQAVSLLRQPISSAVSNKLLSDQFFDSDRSRSQYIYGHRVPGPRVEGNPFLDTHSVQVAPRVKFRGARLGYLTDRAGNGGW